LWASNTRAVGTAMPKFFSGNKKKGKEDACSKKSTPALP
jgi:hypothetical protein